MSRGRALVRLLVGPAGAQLGLRFAGRASRWLGPDPRFTPDETTGGDTADHCVSGAARAFAGSPGRDPDVVLAGDAAAARELATAPGGLGSSEVSVARRTYE